MIQRILVAFLILAASAAAESYSVTTGNVAIHEGHTFNFTLYTGSDADLRSAIIAYRAVESSNDTAVVTAAKEEVRDALERAKADDRVHTSSPWRSELVPYNSCAEFDVYAVCFTSVLYAEEDGPPLGDSVLNSVRYEKGVAILPFTMTITKAASSVTGQRSLSSSSVFVGDIVTVTITVTNNGDLTSGRIDVVDAPPLPLYSSLPTELHMGSLAADETEQLTYTVRADRNGTFTFDTRTAEGVTIPQATLIVTSPLRVQTSIQETAFVGDLVPFTINVTSQYTEDIDVSTLSLTTPDGFSGQVDGPGTIIVKPGEQLLRAFKIEPSKSVVFTGALRPEEVGTRGLDLSISYSAEQQDSYRESYPLTVLAREVLSRADFSGDTAYVTVTNNALETIDVLTFTFSDGHVERRTSLRSGREVVVSHTYTGDSGPQAATVILTYDFEGEQRREFAGTVIPGTAPTPPAQEQPAPESVPETPIEGETPQQPPTAATPGAPAESREGRSVLKRFLDWLDGIF